MSSAVVSEQSSDNKKKIYSKEVLQNPDCIFSNFVQWVKMYKKPDEHRENHSLQFPAVSNRIQRAPGTLWRHPIFLRIVTVYKVTQEHYDTILPIFLQWISEYKVPQEHYDASLSVFPQWVTRYKVPHKHHDISLAIFYTVTCCLSLHRLLSSHSHPSQKTIIWTSILEPDISFMCLRDESALFNPFLPKKNCFEHSKEHKIVWCSADNWQLYSFGIT